MSPRHRLLVGAFLCGTSLGCDFDSMACPLAAMPAITVTVRDASDGSPAAAGAFGLVQGGAFLDTLRLPPTLLDSTGATELYSQRTGPGLYTVTVSKPGYATWRVDGVRVRDGDCGLIPVAFQAGLTRAP